MADKTTRSKIRTRRAILNLLKTEGALDSARLAASLNVSAMAVRQHLYDLQAQALVGFREEPRPLGRPAKLWHLTEAADAQFPEAYAELSVDLIQSMKETFGPAGLEKLLETRMRKQVERYRAQLGQAETLKQKLKALARARTAEGYMAEVKPDAQGGLIFTEHHCPICAAAKICEGLCWRELETFQAVLGEGVLVERTEHLLAADRRCAYRVRPK